VSSRSTCCSETVHACLYVSDLRFSFLAVGGSIGGVHLSVAERILAYAAVAGLRFGAGQQDGVGHGEYADWDSSADGREIKAPPVVAISTSALSSLTCSA
jgi:pseudouridine-5'-phosphate glycosidase